MPLLPGGPIFPSGSKIDFGAWFTVAVHSGDKYKRNEKDIELIGVESPVLWWATESGYDNSTDHTGSAGCSVSTFDYSSRADSAQIKLINSSGVTQYLRAVAIKALPVMRRSGAQGLLHDAFVDYDDIYQSGESKFEFGNNYTVSKAQLEALADYWWKYLRSARHMYGVTVVGTRYDFEPGEWYTLKIGGEGQREYIDSVCECYAVTTSAGAGIAPATAVVFREVYQNWVKDSGAVARFLATGDPRQLSANFARVLVAAPEYLGPADYYCPAASAQTVIQQAIEQMVGAGGGMVELTEGTFRTTAAIDVSYNNIMLRGAGWKTVIEKNCDAWGIRIVGTVAGTIDSVILNNFKITRNAADTNNVGLIYGLYAKDLTLDTVWAYDGMSNLIDLEFCNDLLIANSKSTQAVNCGFYLRGWAEPAVSISAKIHSCVAGSAAIAGFFLDGVVGGSLVGCQSYDNGAAGIYLDYSCNNTVTGNVIRNNNTGAASVGACGGLILVASCVGNVINGNIVSDNARSGIYVYDATCTRNIVTGNYAANNTVNFIDDGVETQSGI